MIAKLYRNALILYIIARLAVDFVSLLSQNAVSNMASMGWPVNKFWIGTTFPVVAALLVLALYGLGKGYFEWIVAMPLITISCGWALTLILYKETNAFMFVDALSWMAVAICSILYTKKN